MKQTNTDQPSRFQRRCSFFASVPRSVFSSPRSMHFSVLSPKHLHLSCVIHVLKGSLVNYLFPQHVNKSITPFDIIHTDLWGHAPSILVDVYRYYTIFVYECTRYCWIFPLVNKSKLFSTFVVFYSFVSTQFASTIKTLQPDGG